MVGSGLASALARELGLLSKLLGLEVASVAWIDVEPVGGSGEVYPAMGVAVIPARVGEILVIDDLLGNGVAEIRSVAGLDEVDDGRYPLDEEELSFRDIPSSLSMGVVVSVVAIYSVIGDDLLALACLGLRGALGEVFLGVSPFGDFEALDADGFEDFRRGLGSVDVTNFVSVALDCLGPKWGDRSL